MWIIRSNGLFGFTRQTHINLARFYLHFLSYFKAKHLRISVNLFVLSLCLLIYYAGALMDEVK